MTLATDLINISNQLLQTHGQSISVVRDNTGDFAPSAGTVADTGDAPYTGYGYPSRYKFNQIDGELINQKDTRLIFRSTTQPLVNDIFTFNDQSFTALDVQTITQAGVNILYIVQLRQ